MKNILLISITISTFFLGCVKEIKSDSPKTENPFTVISSGRPTTSSILQWQKCFGSSAEDLGYSVAKAFDNSGYFITGNASAAANITDGNVSGCHGGNDAWVVKINLDGIFQWQIAVGGSASDVAHAIVGTPDGGCLIAGITNSNDGNISDNHGGDDVLVAKISATGSFAWSKALGGGGYDNANALIQTTDGEYALTGSTTSIDGDVINSNVVNGNEKLWLVKFNISTGTAVITWQKTIGVPETRSEKGYALTQGANDGYTIAGTTLPLTYGPDIWVINTNNIGEVNWEKKIASSGGDVGFGVAACKDINGSINGYVVTGYLSNNLAVVKLNLDGTTYWQKTFLAGGTSGNIQGRSILSTNQGDIIVGITDSKNGEIIATKGGQDMFILRLDDVNGNKISSNVFGGKGADVGRSIITTDDGAFLVLGSTSSNNGDVSGNHGMNDLWTVKVKY